MRVYTRRPVAERFWEKVERSLGCWLWTGALFQASGYGQFSHTSAHRVGYELQVGPIPEGFTIDHLCRNRACVRGDHLEAVTMKENLLRGNGWSGRNVRKTHCKWGHPFDEKNTHWLKGGGRRCLACGNRMTRRWRQQQRWRAGQYDPVALPNAKKTQCKLGHPYDAENTYWEPSGSRSCRKCRALSEQKRRNRLKEQRAVQ